MVGLYWIKHSVQAMVCKSLYIYGNKYLMFLDGLHIKKENHTKKTKEHENVTKKKFNTQHTKVEHASNQGARVTTETKGKK